MARPSPRHNDYSHDHRSYGGPNVGDANSYFWQPLWRNRSEKTLLKLP